jgi:hypothetical protein
MRELVVIQDFSTAKRFNSGRQDHTEAETAVAAFGSAVLSERG